MRQIIDIKVPTCWQQLSDKQLRFVFKLLNGNFSLPQVKALCLLKWAKMKILRREGSIFIIKYHKQKFPISALQITEVTSAMEWLGDFPAYPVRLARIGLHRPLPADFQGVPFGTFLALDNLYQGYLQTHKNDIAIKMARVMYQSEHIRHLSKVEEVNVFYWFTSVKRYFAGMFTHFFKQVEDDSLAISNGIRFDYLLVDSWFTNTQLVKFIQSRRIGCHLLGMVKMGNTLYHTEFGDITAKQIAARLKKEKRVSKSNLLHCVYCHIDATLSGRPVRLFFCKRGRKGEWNGLLTTDRSLDFLTAYRKYQMRWAVEVGYHECKGFLGLGKCQSRNFNAQIASTTITLIQYNILSIVKRYHSYETIGELFNCAVGGAVELSVTEKIWDVLLKAIFAVADKFSIYAPDVLKAIIDADEDLMQLMKLNVKLREAS